MIEEGKHWCMCVREREREREGERERERGGRGKKIQRENERGIEKYT